MAFRKLMKRARPLARKAYKKVIHPYVNKRKGRNNRMKLYAEVAAIKKMINAEKKEVRTYQSAGNVGIGQINQNTDNAYWQQDITPVIPQGAADGQRNGDVVKINSMLIKGIIQQQSAAVLPQRLRYYVVRVKGTPETVNINNFLIQNPQTSCTDFNSIRNKERFRNYQVVRTGTIKMSSDQYSGQGSTFKDFKIPLKFKHYHLDYLSGTTTPTNGQMILYIVADSGNINAANSASTTIPITTALTGSLVSYTCDAWYYDN